MSTSAVKASAMVHSARFRLLTEYALQGKRQQCHWGLNLTVPLPLGADACAARWSSAGRRTLPGLIQWSVTFITQHLWPGWKRRADAKFGTDPKLKARLPRGVTSEPSHGPGGGHSARRGVPRNPCCAESRHSGRVLKIATRAFAVLLVPKVSQGMCQ